MNWLLWTFIILLVASRVLKLALTSLNLRHLRRFGHIVPRVFENRVDQATLARMNDYTMESSRFGALEGVFDDLVLAVIVLSGFLPWLAALSGRTNNFILAGLAFFGALFIISAVLEIPFGLYGTFVIERKYGFSTITARLWIEDLLKNFLISCVLSGLLFAALLTLIRCFGGTWWIWSWLVFAIFQLLVLWLYPVLLAPLFNRFEPVRDEALRESIVELAGRRGIHVGGVFQVDAGKRSRHSNAYFTGIGMTKRIVLYDTLLESHSRGEILAVLAHEIGHWARHHVFKQLVLIEAVSLVGFYIAYRMASWPALYAAFGFQEMNIYAGLFLIGALFRPPAILLAPAGAALSRHYERQADDESLALIGDPAPLADALRRLAADNLANLHPHPVYAWFNYSHPPLAERIERLESKKGA